MAGIFYPPINKDAWFANLIITHGFRGSKEGGGRALNLGKELSQRGYGVLCFDFAGVGESEGDFAEITLSRQVEDLQAAVDWLIDRAEGQKVPLFGLGRSFGGSTLLITAAQDPRIAGLCLWSTPYNLEETFSRILAENFASLASGPGFVELEDEKGKFRLRSNFVQDLSCHDLHQALNGLPERPLLIIHGEEDEVVPVEQALKAYTLAKDPKQISLISKGDHQFSLVWPQVWEEVFLWLDKYAKSAEIITKKGGL